MDKIIKKIKRYDCPICREEHDINVYQEADGHKYFYCENDFDGRDIEEDEENFLTEVQGEMTKFIYGTLRSGQEIDYEGHVVVVGDVNPGALIKANGNAVILWNLRGVVYAGLGGDRSSIIAAYKLLATQLRICEIIGRAPDETEFHYKVPEIVKLVDGKLMIEPYLPNR